jgi:acyl-CoA reductase-like NAD-dependent aldehyde dehydrogenase
VAVRKTYKMLVNGALVRPESGRVAGMSGALGPARVPVASRKDTRDAVRAAVSAQAAWWKRTPYNRGQIVYRMAEMLEARRDGFDSTSPSEVDAAVDRLVYWAGWCDKLTSVTGSANAVSTGSYLNVSTLDPTGVVAAFIDTETPLLSVADIIGSALAAGNTVVAVCAVTNAPSVLTFGEVISTSDVPGGVVNLLSSDRAEVANTLAEHGDVHALDLSGAASQRLDVADLERRAAGTLKRVRRGPGVEFEPEGPARATWAGEIKTLWHPTGR